MSAISGNGNGFENLSARINAAQKDFKKSGDQSTEFQIGDYTIKLKRQNRSGFLKALKFKDSTRVKISKLKKGKAKAVKSFTFNQGKGIARLGGKTIKTIEDQMQQKTQDLLAILGDGMSNDSAILKLIREGANPNTSNGGGITPLMSMSVNGDIEAVKELLAVPGIDVNQKDNGDQTALYWAIGNADTVRVLLDSGKVSKKTIDDELKFNLRIAPEVRSMLEEKLSELNSENPEQAQVPGQAEQPQIGDANILESANGAFSGDPMAEVPTDKADSAGMQEDDPESIEIPPLVVIDVNAEVQLDQTNQAEVQPPTITISPETKRQKTLELKSKLNSIKYDKGKFSNYNYDELLKLIKEGADPNTQNELGNTALMIVIVAEIDPKKVTKLLNAGADVSLNVEDKSQSTALSLAIQFGKTEVAKALLDTGKISKEKIQSLLGGYLAEDIKAILQEAVKTAKTKKELAVELTEELVAAAAKLAGVTPEKIKEQKTQELAGELSRNRTDFGRVLELISEGADVNATNGLGETALHIAVKNRDSKTIQALLEITGINVNATDKNGQTALSLAAISSDASTIKILIASKEVSRETIEKAIDTLNQEIESIDSNLKEIKNAAVEDGGYSIYDDFDDDFDDDFGDDDNAVASYNEGLKRGYGDILFDLRKALDKAKTAEERQAAAQQEPEGKPDEIEAKIEAATATQVDTAEVQLTQEQIKEQKTQELVAEIGKPQRDFGKILQLIKDGANPNKENSDNLTALMVMSFSGEIKAVKELLKISEIDVNKVGANNMTALDLAVWAGKSGVIQELLATEKINKETIESALKEADKVEGLDEGIKAMLEKALATEKPAEEMETDIDNDDEYVDDFATFDDLGSDDNDYDNINLGDNNSDGVEQAQQEPEKKPAESVPPPVEAEAAPVDAAIDAVTEEAVIRDGGREEVSISLPVKPAIRKSHVPTISKVHIPEIVLPALLGEKADTTPVAVAKAPPKAPAPPTVEVKQPEPVPEPEVLAEVVPADTKATAPASQVDATAPETIAQPAPLSEAKSEVLPEIMQADTKVSAPVDVAATAAAVKDADPVQTQENKILTDLLDKLRNKIPTSKIYGLWKRSIDINDNDRYINGAAEEIRKLKGLKTMTNDVVFEWLWENHSKPKPT